MMALAAPAATAVFMLAILLSGTVLILMAKGKL